MMGNADFSSGSQESLLSSATVDVKYRSMSMASTELQDAGQSPQDWQYQEIGPGRTYDSLSSDMALYHTTFLLSFG